MSEESKIHTDILEENRVNYKETIDNGLVVRRQHNIAFAPHRNYVATTSPTPDFRPVLPPPIEIEISLSASDYVDGHTSWLTFDLTTNKEGDADFSFGNGSAMNWIKDIKVIGADGQVIDDLSDANLFMTFRDRWTKSSGYFDTDNESVSELKGYGVLGADGLDNGYACPLNELLPLFNYDGLLPSNLVNGMRFLITMAPPYEMLKAVTGYGGAPDVNYTISNLKVMLDTYTMDYRLQELISKDVQVIEYQTYKTQKTPYAGKELNLSLQYAVSRASQAFVVTKSVSTGGTGTTIGRDNLIYDFMAGEDTIDLEEYRWRIGNMYQPNVPIQNVTDTFAHALTVWRKFSTNVGNVGISPSSFIQYQNCFCVNLRRAGGGTPINNGNECTLQLIHDTTLKREAVMFCQYTKKIAIDPVSSEEETVGLKNRIAIFE